MKTLIINSYAGSLTLGAKTMKMDIIGSYEDSNFGLDIQKHNMPELDYIEKIDDWPTQDLTDVFVIAHPPCSAFSVQNTSKTARGIDSAAFACTKKVLQYAVDNKAIGIAIESVMGALGGAWEIHQHYADEHGYYLYRLLENGCMFGAQWRDRFWVLYLRKDAVKTHVGTFTIQPQFQTVAEVVSGFEDGSTTGNLDKLLLEQKQRLIDDAECTPDEMSFFFDTQDPHHETQALGKLVWATKFKHLDRWEVFKAYIGGFASGTMCFIDPQGLCPTLMGGSFWYMNGRCVSEDAYKLLMGFPADYEFPNTPRAYRNQMRMYLSKGVMPPIAAWILEQAAVNLRWMEPQHHVPGERSYTISIEPNHIADFRIRKIHWPDRNETLPPLRHYDDVRPKGQRREKCCLENKYQADHVFCSVCAHAKSPLGHDVPVGSGWCSNSCEGYLLEPEVMYTYWPDEMFLCAMWKGHEGLCSPKIARSLAFRRTSMGDRKLKLLTSVGLDSRRSLIYQIISELEEPTLDGAIEKCLQHPEIPILPTTCRWHIRQMIKLGYMQEILPNDEGKSSTNSNASGEAAGGIG